MKPKSSQGLYPSYSSVSPATIPDPYPTFSTQHSQPPPSYSSTFYSAQPPTQDHYSTSHQTHSVHAQHSISHHSIPPSFAPQQSFIPTHKEGYPTPLENQPNQQYIPPPLPPDYGHPPRQSNPPSAAHYRGTPTLSNEAERLRNKCAELQSGLASAEQDMGHLKQQLKALLLKRRQMSFDLYEAQELIHQLGVGPPPRPLACISDLFGEPKPIPISTSNNIPVNNDHDDDEVPSNKLLVALSKQVRQEEFRAIVSALPEYISAEIKYDPVTKESKGIGIIKFASVPAAIKAKQVLINQEIGGRGIVINFAETEPTPVLKDKIKPKEKKIKTEKDSQRRSKSRNRSKERNKEIRRSRDKEDSFRRRDPSRGPPPPINVPRNEDRRRKSNERADEPPLRRRRLFDVGPNEFRNGTREGDGARSSWDYRGPPSSARDGRDGRDRESQPSFKMGGYRGGRGSSRNESHDGHRRQSPDDHNANDYNGREDHAESDGRADEDRHSDGNNNGPASFRNRGRYSNRGRRGYVGTSSVSKSAGFRGRRGTAGGRFQR